MDSHTAEQLWRRHARRLHGLALRRLDDPHDAEDAVQETFLRALAGGLTVRPGVEPGRWLSRVAINCCTDEQRRRRRLAAYDPATDGRPGARRPHRRAAGGARSPQTPTARRPRLRRPRLHRLRDRRGPRHR